ncbi:UNVERIFIED_CONTAM: hypothetical protein NCL1_45293 [Trichonephila clavipes]
MTVSYVQKPLTVQKKQFTYHIYIERYNLKLAPKRKRIPPQEEILQMMNKSDSELLNDDYAAGKTYEPRSRQ